MEITKELHNPLRPFPVESLERLRLASHMDTEDWQDLLQLSWWDYSMIRSGKKRLPENSLIRLAEHFQYSPQSLIHGQVDFHGLQAQTELQRKWTLPGYYSFATYGRRRTTITSFEYIEKYHGWRLRYDVLKHLNLSEAMLMDPFAPITMKIITDAFAYLARRQFTAKDFFAMGMYSFVGNAQSILGRFYAQLGSPREVLEHMWGDCLKFYEKNCRYRFLKLNDEGATIEVTSETTVAEEMGIVHLGNEHICALKAGMMASSPMYLGHPRAKVIEKSCVHKGAAACVFEVTFVPPQFS